MGIPISKTRLMSVMEEAVSLRIRALVMSCEKDFMKAMRAVKTDIHEKQRYRYYLIHGI